MAFEDCICFQLGRSLRQVTKAYRHELAEYKLTHGQFFLLVAISVIVANLSADLLYGVLDPRVKPD